MTSTLLGLITIGSFVVAAAVVMVAFVLADQRVRRIERSYERREQTLLASNRDLTDRLMHATDKTWTLPPETERDDDGIDVWAAIEEHPEQTLPDFEPADTVEAL